MNAFISQFGLDWKLFLSQLVNFILILIILTIFVYKPVLKIIKERNKKIKEGYSFVSFSLDTLFLGRTSRDLLKNIKTILKDNK